MSAPQLPPTMNSAARRALQRKDKQDAWLATSSPEAAKEVATKAHGKRTKELRPPSRTPDEIIAMHYYKRGANAEFDKMMSMMLEQYQMAYVEYCLNSPPKK